MSEGNGRMALGANHDTKGNEIMGVTETVERRPSGDDGPRLIEIGPTARKTIGKFCLEHGIERLTMARRAYFIRKDAETGARREVGQLYAAAVWHGPYWSLVGTDEKGREVSFSCGRNRLGVMLREAWDAGWGR